MCVQDAPPFGSERVHHPGLRVFIVMRTWISYNQVSYLCCVTSAAYSVKTLDVNGQVAEYTLVCVE